MSFITDSLAVITSNRYIMISQHRVIKSRFTLLKLALGLTITCGLSSFIPALAADLQGVDSLSSALYASRKTAVATPEEIVAELNRVRESPAEYAAWLETLRPYYDGQAFRFPGESAVQTTEGVGALDAAIRLLSEKSPMPLLTLESGLVLSTRGHLAELLAHDRFTLSGLDGSTPVERAEHHGAVDGQLIGLLRERHSSAAAIVAALVIDDGHRGRSTQAMLLDSDVTSVGAVCGVGAGVPLCVFAYADGYVSSGEALVAANPGNERTASRPVRAGSMNDPAWFGDLSESELVGLSEELVAETNKMRANPAAYARRLEAIRDYYEGNLVKVPGRPAVKVVEGVSALDEAIAVLRGSQPLGALAFSPGMSFGASDHADDLGSKGITGHYGSDGSDPFARISRYGEWRNGSSENISYGQATIAEWHLINLLVDDNVPSRGHRQALLEPTYSAMGAACQEHPGFRIVCVMNYASEYQEKAQYENN
ncbi:MAG: CAP domain-containing protein [Phormidesmis sp.]